MKREFYYQDDRSNKFWSIEQTGNEIVTANCNVGAKPREIRKQFDDEGVAKRAVEKQVTSKLRKGYLEGSVPDYEKPDWEAMTMSDEVFWRIIGLFNWSRTDDDTITGPAVKALATMDDNAIFKFDDILSVKLRELDTRAHCNACYAGELNPDNGEISADDFLYSRCVVVANGREFFIFIRKEPVKMPQDMEFEQILTLAESAFEKKSGKSYGHVSPVSYESFQNETGWGFKADS